MCDLCRVIGHVGNVCGRVGGEYCDSWQRGSCRWQCQLGEAQRRRRRRFCAGEESSCTGCGYAGWCTSPATYVVTPPDSVAAMRHVRRDGSSVVMVGLGGEPGGGGERAISVGALLALACWWHEGCEHVLLLGGPSEAALWASPPSVCTAVSARSLSSSLRSTCGQFLLLVPPYKVEEKTDLGESSTRGKSTDGSSVVGPSRAAGTLYCSCSGAAGRPYLRVSR